MPQIDFTPENRRESASRAETLKIKLNETVRIVMFELPTFAWTHTLRAPKIVNGKAVKEIKKKGTDEEYLDYVMDFIGRPLCPGDYGILADKGVDPKNCPACEAAVKGGEVPKPERRFAVNVIRYGLNRDGGLVSPFSCTCIPWVFSEGVWDKLYIISQEHGDLKGKDLVFGNCQPPEHFQRFDIHAGAKDIWKADKRITEIVVETYRNNRVEDLEERAIARRVEKRFMERDLDTIAERWRYANRTPSGPDGAEAATSQSLTEGLDDLLNTAAAPPASAPPVSPDSVDLTDLLSAPAQQTPPPTNGNGNGGGLDFSDLIARDTDAAPSAPSAAVAQPAPAPDAQPAEAPKAEVTDFESLLNQLST